MHMGHIAWPDNQFALFTGCHHILMRESGAPAWCVGKVEHPHQRTLAVLNAISLAVNGRIAATLGIPLNVGMLRKPQRAEAISARAVVIGLKIAFDVFDKAIKKIFKMTVQLDRYRNIETVLHCLVNSVVFTEPARLGLVPVTFEEFNDLVAYRFVDIVGFNKCVFSHKSGTKKRLSRPLFTLCSREVYD